MATTQLRERVRTIKREKSHTFSRGDIDCERQRSRGIMEGENKKGRDRGRMTRGREQVGMGGGDS